MNQQPLVSVLLPAYKAARFLDDAIQSVLQQTYPYFELIIVDNNSDDDTDTIVKKYLQDSRVAYYKNETNIGMIGNWNKCLSYAKGKYIKYLMADDRFDTDMLRQYVAIMEQYPEVSLVTCYKGMFGENFSGDMVLKKLPLSGYHSGETIIRDTLQSSGWLGEPTLVMFRREHVFVGPFNPRFTWLPDWEMWLRLLSVGNCYILPEPLAHVRVHLGQVTTSVMKNATNYFEEYQLCVDILQGKYNNVSLPHHEMRRIVKRRAGKFIIAIIHQLPHLNDKKHRLILAKAIAIIKKEHVLLSGSWQITKDLALRINERMKTKLFPNF